MPTNTELEIFEYNDSDETETYSQVMELGGLLLTNFATGVAAAAGGLAFNALVNSLGKGATKRR